MGNIRDLQFVPNVRKWSYLYNKQGQRYPIPRDTNTRDTNTRYVYHANIIFNENHNIYYYETGENIRLSRIYLKIKSFGCL